MNQTQTQTQTPETVPAIVPAVPAEILETIPTAAPRLAVPAAARAPHDIGRARSATVAPRAWTMGGHVD